MRSFDMFDMTVERKERKTLTVAKLRVRLREVERLSAIYVDSVCFAHLDTQRDLRSDARRAMGRLSWDVAARRGDDGVFPGYEDCKSYIEGLRDE